MKKQFLILALMALSGSALAQDAMKGTMLAPDTLAWKDNPSLPKGTQIAVLLGDPAKAGDSVVVRVKLPPNYKIPPHTHPYAEVVTVMSGSINFSMGEKFDATKGATMKAGTFNVVPPKHAHYAWTGNESVILQVQFTGPAVIDYINPADDPRKTAR
jgi:quercetin dioxygenase-like cupin family protein